MLITFACLVVLFSFECAVFLGCVHLCKMVVQVALRRKRLHAVFGVAVVGLLAGVQPQVRLKVALLVEGLAAVSKRTDEVPLSCVLFHVHF